MHRIPLPSLYGNHICSMYHLGGIFFGNECRIEADIAGEIISKITKIVTCGFTG